MEGKVKLPPDLSTWSVKDWEKFAAQFLPGGVKRRLVDHIIELRKAAAKQRVTEKTAA